jgi:hypothetical protein
MYTSFELDTARPMCAVFTFLVLILVLSGHAVKQAGMAVRVSLFPSDVPHAFLQVQQAKSIQIPSSFLIFSSTINSFTTTAPSSIFSHIVYHSFVNPSPYTKPSIEAIMKLNPSFAATALLVTVSAKKSIGMSSTSHPLLTYADLTQG